MRSMIQLAICLLVVFIGDAQTFGATLVAQWDFFPANRAADNSGNNNNLTNLAGVTSYSAGPNGYVAANISNSSTISVDRALGLNNFTGLGGVSYSAWFNLTNPANGQYQGIISQDTSSVPVGDRILVNPSGNLYIDTGNDHSDQGTSIAVGTGWHQVVMTVADSGTSRDTLLYLDGTLRDTIVQTGNLPNASTWTTWLGAGEQGTQWPLTSGALADVRVYQGALTGDQVATLFATVVPEPSTFVLGGFGVIGLLVAARRRRKA